MQILNDQKAVLLDKPLYHPCRKSLTRGLCLPFEERLFTLFSINCLGK